MVIIIENGRREEGINVRVIVLGGIPLSLIYKTNAYILASNTIYKGYSIIIRIVIQTIDRWIVCLFLFINIILVERLFKL